MSRNDIEYLEREGRRLRARHAGDLLTVLAIGLDSGMRRLAYRISALFTGR